MSFNSIPDDCIRLVLDRITLQTLIPLRIICRRWKAIIESMYRGKCSLVLYDQADLYRCTDYCKLTRLTLSVTQILNKRKCPFECFFLAELFCNLTCLEVNIRAINSLKDIIPLLFTRGNWCDTLNKLTISSDFILPPIIWHHVNQMKKLEKLILKFAGPNDTVPEGMTVLGQLKHFYIYGNITNLLTILAQLGPEMRKLKIGTIRTLSEILDVNQFEALARTSEMTHNIIKFDYNFIFKSIEEQVDWFRIVCTYFTGLTIFDSFKWFVDDISAGKLFAELSRLPNLTKVIGLSFDDKHIDMHPSLWCPLKSVKYVTLSTAQTFNNTESLIRNLPKLFPAMEELHVWEYLYLNSNHSQSQCSQIEELVEAIGRNLKICSYECYVDYYED